MVFCGFWLLLAPLGADPDTQAWGLRPWLSENAPAQPEQSSQANPIDLFILTALKSKGLQPAPRADKATLLRRVHFTLTGLSPTAQEVEQFVNDNSPAAYARKVDKLLSSREHAERWARHWLDVARYADSKGYAFLEDRHFHFAWTYRDWVVSALQKDLPYDRFIQEQLAADLLHPPGGDGRENLAALGFLTVGRRFLNNPNDILDDRIDVVTRGLLGLTVACARCHDHKTEPIDQADYYGLQGVLSASKEPKQLPLIGPGPANDSEKRFLAEQQKRDQAVADFTASRHQIRLDELRQPASLRDHLLASIANATDRTELSRTRSLNPHLVERLEAYWQSKSAEDAWWSVWQAARNASPIQLPQAIKNALSKPAIPAPLAALSSASSLEALATAQANLISTAFQGDNTLADLAKILHSPDSPWTFTQEQTGKLLGREDRDQQRDLQRQVDEWRAVTPPNLARALALEELPNPPTPHIFKRGNPSRLGDEVPCALPACLDGGTPLELGAKGGRLALARALTRPTHPLLARILVNRVWQWHFGQGLSRTPSDCGSTGDTPSHPELLDFLAREFIRQGWSLRKLHRLIVTSETYKLSSQPSGAAQATDPTNRYLSHQNLRRLDWESLRDRLVQAGGGLQPSTGGPPVPLLTTPYPRLRSLYGYVDRQQIPMTVRAFDAANPDTHVAKRAETTTGLQGLALLNAPLVLEQARSLGASLSGSTTDRLNQLFRHTLSRNPTPAETSAAVEFLDLFENPPPVTTSPWQAAMGRWDQGQQKIIGYQPLAHFTGQAWQPAPLLPTPDFGRLNLTSIGGIPGNKPDQAVVRRFTAPESGTIVIDGTLRHPDYRGDGVEAFLVSSRHGPLGFWKVLQDEVATKVKPIEIQKGDTLDWLVISGGDAGYDGFLWSPSLRYTATSQLHDSSRDFCGPQQAPLSPWQALAQALLLSNEFHFVH